MGWRSVSAVVGVVLAAAVAAQEPKPQDRPPAEPAKVPEPVPAPAAEQDRARKLLAELAEASRGLRALQAEYVQRRTTQLSKEPLESRGTFVFVREPGAVLFRAREPRVSVVRLAAASYEVYRPQKHQLERFLLDGPELAQGLFAAIGGDARYLTDAFVVTACAPPAASADPAAQLRTTVVLAPKDPAIRERLRELRLALDTVAGEPPHVELHAVAYRDHSGDLIEIELRDVVRNPDPLPSAALDTPKDTTVVEHRVERRG